MDARFCNWYQELEKRLLSDLTLTELRKGLVALSRIYVERRGVFPSAEVFRGASKRAAFACFYSPLHFLLVREIVNAIEAGRRPPKRIFDLGCGLGVGGAAWALLCSPPPPVVGIERHPWAIEQARLTFEALGVRGRVLRKPIEKFERPQKGEAVLAAFTVNELDPPARARLLDLLLAGARRGATVLVIEPIARRGRQTFWREWSDAFRSAGGREDDWRFEVELPERILALDRASGMDHRELTGKSLYIGA